MAMFSQTAKQVIDVGEVGNASTGDILYDGGVKINDNFDAVYNAFGDQRLYSTSDGEASQKVYATGYYQKLPVVDYVASSVENGTCHDIDTTAGAVTVRLSKGKLGESVYFINSNGTFSKSKPLVIDADDSFSDGTTSLTVTYPFSTIQVWCTAVAADGTATWRYKVGSMFGNTYLPSESTSLLTSAITTVTLVGADQYAAFKLLISAANSDGSMRRTSEVLVMVDNVGNAVYDTEYAVIKFGDNGADNLFNITYSIDANSNVVANVSSTLTGVRFTIKILTTQAFGVAS